MKSENLGLAWLKANDPSYVSPAKKAAKTRKIALNLEAMGNLISGQSAHKVAGKWIQIDPLAFGAECSISAHQEQDVELYERAQSPIRRRGKRGGRK